jgi:hypothetical protein
MRPLFPRRIQWFSDLVGGSRARFLLAQAPADPAVNPNRKGRKDDLSGVLRSSAGCRSPLTCADFTNGAVLHHLQWLYEFLGKLLKKMCRATSLATVFEIGGGF